MSQKPKNFRDAIDELEDQDVSSSAGESSTGDDDTGGGHRGAQARLEREIRRMEELLSSMKPHLDDLSGKVGEEAHRARRRLEQRVTREPLKTLGIAALIGFVIGLIFGSRRRH